MPTRTLMLVMIVVVTLLMKSTRGEQKLTLRSVWREACLIGITVLFACGPTFPFGQRVKH